MKLISLNTWGGRGGRDKLLAFFDAHRDADIFCLQEMWSAPYEHLEGHAAGGRDILHAEIMTRGVQEVSTLLRDHAAFFHPHHMENYGLLILVKKTIPMAAAGDVFVYKHRGYAPEGDIGGHARNVQYATVETLKGNRTVMNFHGLWNGAGKSDSEDRLLQSDRIIDLMKTFTNPFVMCGDFNLLPDTESLKKFESFGLRNLIKESGITDTRTSYYTKEHRYADYALVSDGIEVRDFQLLPDEVSDHKAMYLDFE